MPSYSAEDKEKIVTDICKLIKDGMSTRKAIKEIKIASDTFYDWLDNDSNKAEQYARACELRAELKFESIEDDYEAEPQRDAETGRIDPGWVSLQRLKIDAKKWELSKMMPKKYGEKIDIDHTTKGDKIQTIVREIVKADN